jgi:hypothetical protein
VGIVFGPALLLEGVVPALAPEIGVVGGEAVEDESSDAQPIKMVLCPEWKQLHIPRCMIRLPC